MHCNARYNVPFFFMSVGKETMGDGLAMARMEAEEGVDVKVVVVEYMKDCPRFCKESVSTF